MLTEIITSKRVISIGEEILILQKPTGEIAEEADILYATKLEEYLQKGVPSRLTVNTRIKAELLEMGIDMEGTEKKRSELMRRVNDFYVKSPELKNRDLLSNVSLFETLVKKLSSHFTTKEVETLAQGAIIDSVRSERYTQTAESFANIQKTKFLISKCILDREQKTMFSVDELTNMTDQEFMMQVLIEWDRFMNDIPSDRVVTLPDLGKT